MTVYVLVLNLSFEPGDVFGVYSTKEKANAAKRKAESEDHIPYGHYEVVAFDLDDEVGP